MNRSIWLYVAVILLLHGNARGEIVYRAIDLHMPHGSNAAFDITGDGIDNFALTIECGGEYPYGWAIRTFESLDNGETQASAILGVLRTHNPPTLWNPDPDLIGPDLSYATSPKPNEWHGGGSWTRPFAKYIGFRTIIESEMHYGWIRMELSGGGEYTGMDVTGLAYQSTPNTAIEVGAVPNPATLAVLGAGFFALRFRRNV